MVYLLISILWLPLPGGVDSGFELPPDSLAQNEATPQPVAMITVEGPINPSTANYILRGIEEAKKMNAQALIVKLDTPGGLLKSTEEIVQAFLKDDGLPIIVWVAPEGASAASAGTFITMAANIAVMAPGTVIGAASPVKLGGGKMSETMQNKLFNYASSFIKSIAKQRNRNAEWAVSAVRKAESITAEKAAAINVVDFIASNKRELLQKIHGSTLEKETLQTANAAIKKIEPSFAETFLGFIMQPLVMMILTMIAIWGIIGEIMNPGSLIPGIAGVIALILVLYASAVMPLNTAGYVLIGLAVILFVAEAFTPTFGILTAGGAVAFFFGFLMLFNKLPESMEISWAWLALAAIATALFFGLIGAAGLKAQFSQRPMGSKGMVGMEAEVVDAINEESGRILARDEYWKAVSDEPLSVGETVVIEEVQGLTMKVKKDK